MMEIPSKILSGLQSEKNISLANEIAKHNKEPGYKVASLCISKTKTDSI
jgi:hypothetical protein